MQFFFNLLFFAPKEEVYPHCEAFVEIMRLQIDGVSHVWFVVTTTPVVLYLHQRTSTPRKAREIRQDTVYGHWPY